MPRVTDDIYRDNEEAVKKRLHIEHDEEARHQRELASMRHGRKNKKRKRMSEKEIIFELEKDMQKVTPFQAQKQNQAWRSQQRKKNIILPNVVQLSSEGVSRGKSITLSKTISLPKSVQNPPWSYIHLGENDKLESYLAKNPEKINARFSNGSTPVMLCMLKNNLKAVNWMLDHDNLKSCGSQM